MTITKVKAIALFITLSLSNMTFAEAVSAKSILKKYNLLTKSDMIEDSKNWGLNAEIGVNSYAAWNLTKGSPNIVIGVIDTGIDSTHSDLKNSLWENPGETGLDANGNDKRTNGIDDDHDGFVDNVHGWDFVNNKDVKTDDHGHGTHIAGIIAGAIHIDSGLGGVAPKVKIAAFKYYAAQQDGLTSLTNTIKSLKLAISKNVNIINYSGGGPEFSEEEFKLLKLAEKKHILIVAASGNESSNSDLTTNYYYPCAYGLSNIICVTAHDQNKNILKSSNWGVSKVDISAPGDSISSTLPKNKYGKLTGTSQATAFVSGIAALMLSKNPNLYPAQIKAILINTVDKVPQLKGKSFSGGIVNAESALLNVFNTKKMISSKKEKIINSDPNRSISSIDSAKNLINQYLGN